MAYNDFNVWVNSAPLISFGGNFDFSIWQNGSPILIQDESGPLASLRGSGVAVSAGVGALIELLFISGKGAGLAIGHGTAYGAAAIAGSGVGLSIGLGQASLLAYLTGSGLGLSEGIGSIEGLGALSGLGLGLSIGLGQLQIPIPPPPSTLHRLLSPRQPRLRHQDFVNERWWSRRVSARSERQRIR